MATHIRWGILGGGKIARKFASDLRLVQDASLAAVASTDREKGEHFKQEFQARFIYDTYEALASSPEVDVIYIATPHGFHHEHAMLCLRNKKAVLCEKAFALNTRQVREMVAEARRQNVFLMEAFWTRFLPHFQKVQELLQQGRIGKIRLIQADFGFKAPEPIAQRLYDPLLGGGSLLDIGIYPVFLAQTLLGKPVDVQALITPFPSGVDEQIVINLKFQNDALALLSSTFSVDTPIEAVIAGTEGRITIRDRFHGPTASVELVIGRQGPERISFHEEEGAGYQFEARHVGDCLRKGVIESPVMTHQDSIDLIETLDRIRKACGIRYGADQ